MRYVILFLFTLTVSTHRTLHFDPKSTICNKQQQPMAKSIVSLSSMFVLSEYWSSEVGQYREEFKSVAF